MTDLATNVTMDTKQSLQVHAPTNRTIARTLHDHDHHVVNFWLEALLSVEVRQNYRHPLNALERASADPPIIAGQHAVRAAALEDAEVVTLDNQIHLDGYCWSLIVPQVTII